jgi:hypothetical protein
MSQPAAGGITDQLLLTQRAVTRHFGRGSSPQLHSAAVPKVPDPGSEVQVLPAVGGAALHREELPALPPLSLPALLLPPLPALLLPALLLPALPPLLLPALLLPALPPLLLPALLLLPPLPPLLLPLVLVPPLPFPSLPALVLVPPHASGMRQQATGRDQRMLSQHRASQHAKLPLAQRPAKSPAVEHSNASSTGAGAQCRPNMRSHSASVFGLNTKFVRRVSPRLAEGSAEYWWPGKRMASSGTWARR